MTLHDEIEAMNDVFFDTVGGFAETVTYLPQGDSDCQFTIDAVVDWDNEEGNNQVRGDGRSDLNKSQGRSVRQTIIVELPTTRVIVTDSETDPPTTEIIKLVVDENGKDRIVVAKHGSDETVTLSVKRVIGRDASAQSVLCVRTVRYEAQSINSRMG